MPTKVNMANVNAELENIHKLILDVKSGLEGKATAKKLDELTTEIRAKDLKIEVLESKVAILENAVNLLTLKCDDNEQYSRRCSLRINNIPVPNGEETAEDVMVKVKEIVKESEADVPDHVIDRAHRVGRSVIHNGERKQQVIVKFTTWHHRSNFYKNRKKLSSAKVYIDLTHTKFKLLKHCQEKVRESDVVEYIFADINCSLCAKLCNGQYKYFSSEQQLDIILAN